MSRIDTSGDCDSNFPFLWPSIVKRAIEGKRGQSLLRELEASLVALPEKSLISSRFCEVGAVCALGALALHRQMVMGISRAEAEQKVIELFPIDDENGPYAAAKKLDIARTLSWEIIEKNDERCFNMTPEKRYEEVLKWVRSQIKG